MQPRMNNPASYLPDAMPALLTLASALRNGGVPATTLDLIHLRASEINGCSACIETGTRHARKAGESEERLDSVATWRESDHFTDAERAALELAEAVTRLSDRTDPVPDAVWEGAKSHYDETALATLVLAIAMTNVWNRLNVTTRQPAGNW